MFCGGDREFSGILRAPGGRYRPNRLGNGLWDQTKSAGLTEQQDQSPPLFFENIFNEHATTIRGGRDNGSCLILWLLQGKVSLHHYHRTNGASQWLPIPTERVYYEVLIRRSLSITATVSKNQTELLVHNLLTDQHTFDRLHFLVVLCL
jgi:hypothetical protein